MKKITLQKIKEMGYVDLMAFLGEVNRPPGGKDAVRILTQNCFFTKDFKVLDVGCNTGYVSFEIARLTKCSVIGVDINENMIKQMIEKTVPKPEFALFDWKGLKSEDRNRIIGILNKVGLQYKRTGELRD